MTPPDATLIHAAGSVIAAVAALLVGVAAVIRSLSPGQGPHVDAELLEATLLHEDVLETREAGERGGG